MNNKTAMIPSSITFLNLFFGFFSILKSIEGNYHIAAWFIILCALIDATDGKLARWTGVESKFGLQLDSISDIVSFGLAPAILIYQSAFQAFSLVGIPLSFFFVFGGAYRLARFNTINSDAEDHQYMGLTIPIAAITVSSFWLFQNAWTDDVVLVGGWISLCIVLPVLMISTVPYCWPRLSFQNGWRKRFQSVGILIGLVAMLVFRERIIFPMFCLYIVLGLLNWTVSIIRGEESFLSLFYLITRRDP
jgi:CDP-diacylglycerol--serine O-phosphatidyltransferase